MTSLTPLIDQIIKTVKAKLEDISEPWANVDFLKVLHAERERLGLSVKVFMKALRYALTGMKVGLSHIFPCLFCFTNINFFLGWTQCGSYYESYWPRNYSGTIEIIVIPSLYSSEWSTFFPPRQSRLK